MCYIMLNALMSEYITFNFSTRKNQRNSNDYDDYKRVLMSARQYKAKINTSSTRLSVGDQVYVMTVMRAKLPPARHRLPNAINIISPYLAIPHKDNDMFRL